MSDQKKYTPEEIEKELPLFVSDKRLSHILSVKKECLAMAKLYRLSEEETEILQKAALLHDITHEKSFEEQRLLLKLYGIPEETADLQSPSVLHQFTGAALAADRFSLENEGVSAISCHTTGKPGMNVSEMILCLADYIEETRPYPFCRALREEFYTNFKEENKERLLYECMLRYLESTVCHLRKKGAYIHPLTLRAEEYYKQKVGNYTVLK